MTKRNESEDRRTVILELADCTVFYDPDVGGLQRNREGSFIYAMRELEDLKDRRRITQNRYDESVERLQDARQLMLADNPDYFKDEERFAARLGDAARITPEDEREMEELHNLEDIRTRYIAIEKMIGEQQDQYLGVAKGAKKMRRRLAA